MSSNMNYFRMLLTVVLISLSSSGSDAHEGLNDSKSGNDADMSLQMALDLVLSAGYDVCFTKSTPELAKSNIPHCRESSFRQMEEENPLEDEGTWEYMYNGAMALLCVSVAALAAGLTLGLLGIDPLLLLIKERAAESPEERRQASQLLPVVKDHHRLLVTLLLMNACANEALPLYLEKLVPPAFAVIVSVTLVLFFGEIIPSAIFTGPNQMQIATALLPLVKTVLWVLYPLAGPIAGLLDWILHDHDGSEDGDDTHSSATYTRGELSALIRIQYEERVASKLKRKAAKQLVAGDHVGGLDFTPKMDTIQQLSLRAAKNQMANADGEFYFGQQRNQPMPSIHQDEVTMVEGALQMSTKVALDVFTPMRRVFSISSDMILTEQNMVKIYAAGFTRVPVYEEGRPHAIVGIIMTKFLIVVNPGENRAVATLPLRTPLCVAPSMPLVHLLNLLQKGGQGNKGGHLALVCARPSVATKALNQGQPIPDTSGLMGIITLEDVLEMLLQEQIYDEMDVRIVIL